MKAIDSVLTEIYTRIDVIDYDGSKFSRIASIFLLGEHSKYAKTISDVNLANKALTSEIRTRAVKILTEQNDIIGGEDWEELDELDVDDLLNTDTVEIHDSRTSQNTNQINISDAIHVLGKEKSRKATQDKE